MIFHSYVNVYQRVNSVWTQNLNSDWMAGCDGWLTIVNFASFSHVFFRSGWDLGDGWYPVVTEHSHCFDDNMAIFWRYSIILSKSSRNWMIFFGTCLQSSKTIGWNWQFPRLCSLFIIRWSNSSRGVLQKSLWLACGDVSSTWAWGAGHILP